MIGLCESGIVIGVWLEDLVVPKAAGRLEKQSPCVNLSLARLRLNVNQSKEGGWPEWTAAVE